jgi:hypothetical protein
MNKWKFQWRRVLGLFFIWLGLWELVGSLTVYGGYSTGMNPNPAVSLVFFLIGAVLLSIEVKEERQEL